MQERLDESGLSGNLWPAHIKPKPDELLSSWLVRLAMAHSLKLHTFCALVWSRRKQIWNRDIDKCADKTILNLLVEKTATPPSRVAQTTLAAYEGYLYERHNPYGNTKWIMPIGIYHRTRRKYGLQFCPRCLAEDKEPYYRRSWRLAFIVFCERHSTPLFDRCPKCSDPLNFHRDELGERRKWVTESTTRCYACRYDLRNTPSAVVNLPSDYRVLEFQKSLTKVMANGWIEVAGYGTIYSHLYFTVLHQLMKICAMGKRATGLREAVSHELNIKSPLPMLTTSRRDIERQDIADRRKLLDMARYLLAEWPQRFIHLCLTHNVWSATLLRDLDDAPFWYWSVVHDYLYQTSYVASDQEILSVINYLNKTGRPIYNKDISRWLGQGDVFRKRKSKVALWETHNTSLGKYPFTEGISELSLND